jgi:hypothetical protein
VVGGVMTLFIIPAMYTLVASRAPARAAVREAAVVTL